MDPEKSLRKVLTNISGLRTTPFHLINRQAAAIDGMIFHNVSSFLKSDTHGLLLQDEAGSL
jgi:hypothetical protein